MEGAPSRQVGLGSPCDEHAAAEKRVVVSIPFARCRVVPFSALGFDYRFAQSVLVTPPLWSLKWIQSVHTQTRWALLGLMRYSVCYWSRLASTGASRYLPSRKVVWISTRIRPRSSAPRKGCTAGLHRPSDSTSEAREAGTHSPACCAVRSAFGTVSASAPSSIGASCACPKLGKPGMHCAVASRSSACSTGGRRLPILHRLAAARATAVFSRRP